MSYEVGSSVASCSCGFKLAIPDGEAADLLALWNDMHTQGTIDEKSASAIINAWEKSKIKESE